MTRENTTVEPATPRCRCRNCNWSGPIADADVEIHNFWERVQPGDEMPAGECPQCGSLCCLVTELSSPVVQEMGHRETQIGLAMYIRIYTNNYRQLSWDEIIDKVHDSYPGQWAVQVFPPAGCVLDDENIYHLFVVDGPPGGLDIRR